MVQREALTENIRRSTKAVLPEEQIPPARMPLTLQAAKKSPLIAVSSKLVPKLIEAGVHIHTIGVDRVTSSFYYLAEGGGEPAVRCEGDLVAAVGAMLGDRADNAAIERVLDGLVDRLLRTLSRDRVSELSLELAAALPRAAADGSGLADVSLESFEKELADLVSGSEKYRAFAEEIASELAETNERRLPVPLFGEARKVSQGPFDLTVGDCKVSLHTHERWTMATPLVEPAPAKVAAASSKQQVAAAHPPKSTAHVEARASHAVTPSSRPPAVAAATSQKVASVTSSTRSVGVSPSAVRPDIAKVPASTEAANKAAEQASAAAERAAAEKLAAERLAAERAAAHAKAAAERAAAEQAAAEQAAAEAKAAAEKLAAERAAAERAAAEQAAAERAAAEQAAAEQAAAEQAAAESKIRTAVDMKKVPPAPVQRRGSSFLLWILLLLVVVVGAAVYYLRHAR
ncbi:MAG: hypothetical protein FWD69_12095 [Polyangiaceae bacterium]|nr:hypothetical protein [Polyangiaceae bacterium]